MREYRIAFFTADWNYDLLESTLNGLRTYVRDHENVRLCVFECFGKDQGSQRDMSEYAIFQLADLSRFDGLLIQGNQIVLGAMRDEIARRVAESGIPALTIDCPIEGCAMLGIDNRAAQRDIANHIIREHGARRVAYLTGILEEADSEGRQRMEGFMDACRENGLRDGDAEIIECSWRANDGLETAERWVREGRALPDAFICGNDEMALALIEGLEKHGYRVPRDVVVTGFDNITSAELSTPRLSTVQRDHDRMNYLAMEYMIAMIDGRESRRFIPFDYEMIFSESCGCSEAARPAYIRDKYFQQTRFLKTFYTMQDDMAQALFDAADMPELMRAAEKVNQVFGCDGICVCINDHFHDESAAEGQDVSRFGREMVLTACGMGEMTADENHVYARFPTAELLPAPLMDRERFLIFYPLHTTACSIGYLVMNDISEAVKQNLHKSVFSFLEIAIENVRKKVLVNRLNEELDDLYVHDALTGLYNRFGFERFGQQTFDNYMRGGGAQVLFVDMDNMKGVNDRFGHEAGDEALRVTAQILRDACAPEDFVMRYGGDEFLVIASDRARGLADAIVRAAGEDRYGASLARALGLSVGVVQSSAANPRTLDDCIHAADAKMYEIKGRKKAGKA